MTNTWGGDGTRFGQLRVRGWSRTAPGVEREISYRIQSTPAGYAQSRLYLANAPRRSYDAGELVKLMIDPATGNLRPPARRAPSSRIRKPRKPIRREQCSASWSGGKAKSPPRATAEAIIAALPEPDRANYPTPDKLAALFFADAFTQKQAAHVTGATLSDAQHAIVSVRVSMGGRSRCPNPWPARSTAGCGANWDCREARETETG